MLRLFKALTVAVLLLAGTTLAYASDTEFRRVAMPDILVRDSRALGGVARLTYNTDSRTYALADGRVTPYVVDGNSIRAMRPDEGGGSMAVATGLAAVDGSVFAQVGSYNTILKLAADGSVTASVSYGTFEYGGQTATDFTAHGKYIYVSQYDGTLLALDSNLQKVGSIKTEHLIANFVIDGDRLYAFNAQLPGPDMGPVYSITAVVVNIADPAHMQVERDESLRVTELPGYMPFQAIDAVGKGWLTASGNSRGHGEMVLEWRSFDKPDVVATQMAMPGRIKAMTTSAPVLAVIENNNALSLVKVEGNASGLALSEPLDLNLDASRHVIVHQQGDWLYVMSGSRLHVADVANRPVMLLTQNFKTSTGEDMLDAADFTLASGLPPISTAASPVRIKALLSKSYLDDREQTELEVLMNKLTASDTWAVEPLTDALKREGGNQYTVRPLAMIGLAHMGQPAASAVPVLLNATMDGAAVLGDMLPKVTAALAVIDPQGDAVVKALPAFVSSHYEAGAKMVAAEILAALPGQAARDALPQYK